MKNVKVPKIQLDSRKSKARSKKRRPSPKVNYHLTLVAKDKNCSIKLRIRHRATLETKINTTNQSLMMKKAKERRKRCVERRKV